MNMKKIKEAKAEAMRFLRKVAELEAAEGDNAEILWGSKQSGAVRRSSMDLTRSLAEMRKSPWRKTR